MKSVTLTEYFLSHRNYIQNFSSKRKTFSHSNKDILKSTILSCWRYYHVDDIIMLTILSCWRYYYVEQPPGVLCHKNLLKKFQRGFPVNFAKFLRTVFLKEHHSWLRLNWRNKLQFFSSTFNPLVPDIR